MRKNIDILYHQNITLSSKMPRKDDRPITDPEPDGFISKIKEWKSYALNPHRMDVLAGNSQ